jgi:hypothetical protein
MADQYRRLLITKVTKDAQRVDRCLDRKEVGANEKVHSAKKTTQAAGGRNLRIFSDFNFCGFCTFRRPRQFAPKSCCYDRT